MYKYKCCDISGRAHSIPVVVIVSIEHSFWIGNVHIYIFCTILMTKQNKLGQFNHLSHPQITKNEQVAPLHEQKGRETLNEHKTRKG